MNLGEFQIIDSEFRPIAPRRGDVRLGIGDDCALLTVPSGQELAISIDTMVEGVHFPHGFDPRSLGHRALAVSLSDLAAMGAEPAWATLSLTLPDGDAEWVHDFRLGFVALADAHSVDLVGGDLTRGPVSVSVQVHGFVPPGMALLRAGATPGHLIAVTGTLGDAAGGLACIRDGRNRTDEDCAYLFRRFERPEPRTGAGLVLRGRASAAIDISDGLIQDLGHILSASGVGAEVEANRVPRSRALLSTFTDDESLQMALAGGDDYELCFTCDPGNYDSLRNDLIGQGVGVTAIGRIAPGSDLALMRNGKGFAPDSCGFRHF